MDAIHTLLTETNNPATAGISGCSTLEMLRLINDEDKKVAPAVERELPHIADAVDRIAARLQAGGRLFYIGAGTSGRLAVVDASECRCTYGVPTDLVQAILAGGLEGIGDAAQGDEDDAAMGREEIRRRRAGAGDAVVGITASGRTPYVLGAIAQANEAGCLTVGLCSNPDTALSRLATVTIAPLTGPEAIEGSTRMKSGTAQKMVLNMLSTGVMIRLGKVYGNLMVDVKPTNEKLVRRCVTIVCEATGEPEGKAVQALESCDYHCKTAIVMLLCGKSADEARALLHRADGRVAEALRLKD